MATAQLNGAFRFLYRTQQRQDANLCTDHDLLARFIQRRDEVAFEVLLRRHGPMVLGVCRRVLYDPHDVEEAFQATFLVLFRKAATLRPASVLANWLYGVAHRTALKARTVAARRHARYRQMESLPEP